MLTAEDLHVTAGRAQLLRGVGIEARPGSVTAIIGPNGAGKSTLLRCLTGEMRPARGRVSIDGRNIGALRAHELAGRRAVLPQSSTLSFPFSVAEVVGLGLRGKRHDAALCAEISAQALERVGMSRHAHRHYQTLSGGEQQRVHLARVLSQVWEPCVEGVANYLLLDEPTSSLDIRHQLDVLELAGDYARRGGGVVVVLHDLEMARLYADHLVVLQRGAVVARGASDSVVTPDLIASVYDLSAEMIAKRWPALARAL
ncbi:heme ABC transporter ATP-binding protein [Breoghania sp. L-A4]|uniref:heme ABC transporter ATP-binding protein n=1 Tax=Breoghania sp. L-A4 TaxID=2304600 RepID=UPI000E35EF5F|nr:heme ABC transporter ATP-binding protein [Breoghania sp. L-A4]AXS38971.1 heme ABC transporter ATP-binding protein [Breoghania sp. L-A4]